MEVTIKYAGFWRRFVASIIDIAILVALVVLLGELMVNATSLYTNPVFAWVWANGITVSCMVGIIYVISFWTWRGQTAGKVAMGVKIVKTDGSSIGIGRAILRYIGYIVSAIIICIGYLMIAWDGKKQGLHDKIGGTYVIKVR